MPYGTQPFMDGSGDYKQPTVINHDKDAETSLPPFFGDKEEALSQFEKDRQDVISEILSINPVYGGKEYNHLTFANQGKLAWDIKKIDAQKDDATWLYNFLRYLRKRKSISNSN